MRTPVTSGAGWRVYGWGDMGMVPSWAWRSDELARVGIGDDRADRNLQYRIASGFPMLRLAAPVFAAFGAHETSRSNYNI